MRACAHTHTNGQILILSVTVSGLLTKLCHDRTEVHRCHRVTVTTKVALQ